MVYAGGSRSGFRYVVSIALAAASGTSLERFRSMEWWHPGSTTETSIHSVSAPTITEMSVIILFGATRSVPAVVPALSDRPRHFFVQSLWARWISLWRRMRNNALILQWHQWKKSSRGQFTALHRHVNSVWGISSIGPVPSFNLRMQRNCSAENSVVLYCTYMHPYVHRTCMYICV